ncbi:DUF72 domain-containing protein [Fervidobacterium nodosum]|uniref:DUF72 domain-containing protein n=1 Tax=Fervidobacterium nodosum (strain ATCC 35602 / DSM 5306 / Rt17-B1) TaxID=381764 RepID=A7HKZ2_FERNB|nr:DUF72 domain-containing protein [Fervidobacterium nodosum]ABS60575.1 protein of unknown function DUF72 [Fervidobacterium nodosum Rt17-B1]PHJ14150.1 hypothetical protein IM41_02510 [Fervidobacterium sp. SC_NGM5_G05]
MREFGKWFIGTSGFSFGDWIGNVYPQDIKKSEMFTYYWQKYGFNCVELNFTFYQMPSSRTMVSLLRKAPVGFKFAVKVHGFITHDRSFENVNDFLKSCRVIEDESRLIGYLAQFPYSFKNVPDNQDYIKLLLEKFYGKEIFLEFRHESWVEWLDNLHGIKNVHVVIPDLPMSKGIFPLIRSLDKVVYLRLHGRNKKRKYDYNYSDEELKGIIDFVFPESFEEAYVFFNNCYNGQALKNALRFREIVGGEKIGIFD